MFKFFNRKKQSQKTQYGLVKSVQKGSLFHVDGVLSYTALYHHEITLKIYRESQVSQSDYEFHQSIVKQIFENERRKSWKDAIAFLWQSSPNHLIEIKVKPKYGSDGKKGKYYYLCYCPINLSVSSSPNRNYSTQFNKAIASSYRPTIITRMMGEIVRQVEEIKDVRSLPPELRYLFLTKHTFQSVYFWHSVVLSAFIYAIKLER